MRYAVIIDLSGKEVNKIEWNGTSNKIKVSGYSDGIYFLKLIDKNSKDVYVSKFIVQHN